MLDPSLFVTETIHEREITLADGSKHPLNFREIPAAMFRRLHSSSGNDVAYEKAVSEAIVASVCLEDGKPAMTIDEAQKLKHGVRLALVIAIADVNDIGSQVGKVLPPATTETGSTT